MWMTECMNDIRMYIDACRESIWIERKRFTMKTAIVTNDQIGTKHTAKITTKTIAKNDSTSFWSNGMNTNTHREMGRAGSLNK